MPMKFKTQTSYFQRLKDKTTKETRNKQTKKIPNHNQTTTPTTIHKEKQHFPEQEGLGHELSQCGERTTSLDEDLLVKITFFSILSNL